MVYSFLFTVFFGLFILFRPFLTIRLRSLLYPITIITNPTARYVHVENGDSNGDGTVDFSDIKSVLYQKQNSDQYKDGIVNAYDFTVVVKKTGKNQ